MYFITEVQIKHLLIVQLDYTDLKQFFAAYVAENVLVGHQLEEMSLVLWRLSAPV